MSVLPTPTNSLGQSPFVRNQQKSFFAVQTQRLKEASDNIAQAQNTQQRATDIIAFFEQFRFVVPGFDYPDLLYPFKFNGVSDPIQVGESHYRLHVTYATNYVDRDMPDDDEATKARKAAAREQAKLFARQDGDYIFAVEKVDTNNKNPVTVLTLVTGKTKGDYRMSIGPIPYDQLRVNDDHIFHFRDKIDREALKICIMLLKKIQDIDVTDLAKIPEETPAHAYKIELERYKKINGINQVLPLSWQDGIALYLRAITALGAAFKTERIPPLNEEYKLPTTGQVQIINNRLQGAMAWRNNERTLNPRVDAIDAFFADNGMSLENDQVEQLRANKGFVPYSYTSEIHEPFMIPANSGTQNGDEFYHAKCTYVGDLNPAECKVTYDLTQTDVQNTPLRTIFTLAINATAEKPYTISGVRAEDLANHMAGQKSNKTDEPPPIVTLSFDTADEALRASFAYVATHPRLYDAMRDASHITDIPVLDMTTGLPKKAVAAPTGNLAAGGVQGGNVLKRLIPNRS